jgi:hypothetical protein
MISALNKHDSSMIKTFSVNVVFDRLFQHPLTECTYCSCSVWYTNSCTDWIWNGYNCCSCKVYKSLRDTCTSCKICDTAGRLSFNDLEDLAFLSYVRYRTWTANIPSHSRTCSRLSVSAAHRKEITALWHSQMRAFFFVYSKSIASIYVPLSKHKMLCPLIQYMISRFPCWIGRGRILPP